MRKIAERRVSLLSEVATDLRERLVPVVPHTFADDFEEQYQITQECRLMRAGIGLAYTHCLAVVKDIRAEALMHYDPNSPKMDNIMVV